MTDFATSIDRLLNQVRHWAAPRWRPEVADEMYALVQLLADLAAEAEGRPPRRVPREPDITLPDQVRVVADDLLAANPSTDVLAKAAEAVENLRHSR